MEKIIEKSKQQSGEKCKPFLDKFSVSFDDVFKLFIAISKAEIDDDRLNDKSDIYDSLVAWYLNDEYRLLKDKCSNLILNIEPYLKKIYYLRGRDNELEEMFSYFLNVFLKDDSRMNSKNIGKFYRDKKIKPEYFEKCHYFGRNLRKIYDLRNIEGHYNPEYDDLHIISTFNDIISVYLYCTAFYYNELKLKFNTNSIDAQESDWNIVLNICGDFNRNYDYFFIMGPNMRLTKDQYVNFANVNWSVIFDFDSYSEKNGLASVAINNMEKKVAIQKITYDNKFDYKNYTYTENTTSWYFANGIVGMGESITTDFFQWKLKYTKLFKETLLEFCKSRTRKPIKVIIMYNEKKYIEELISIISEIFGSSVTYVFVTENNYRFKEIYDSESFKCMKSDISIINFSEGLRSLGNYDNTNFDVIYLPCHHTKGKNTTMSIKNYNIVSQYFELVDLNILDRIKNKDYDKDFYQGRKITWSELDIRKDIDRSITEELKNNITESLSSRSSGEIFCLKYEPGAGATTVALRIAWDLHEKYPTIILNKYDKKHTVENILRIFNITQQAIFLLIDDININESQINDISNLCDSKSIRLTILYLKPEFNCNNRSKNEYFLKLSLNSKDRRRFLEKFKTRFPEKKEIYDKIDSNNNDKELTPFFLGLIAYEKEYISIHDYVLNRLENISDIQREVATLLAFFTYYSCDREPYIPSYIIGKLIGFDKELLILQCEKALESGILYDLIIESAPLSWKSLHYLIAEEILNQTLGRNDNNNFDYIKITEKSNQYIKLLKSVYIERPNNEIMEILAGTFIKRNEFNLEEDIPPETTGLEYFNPMMFSRIINDAHLNDNRIEILENLVNEFEGKEIHFHAHLARLYSICGEYKKGHDELERAMSFVEKEGGFKEKDVVYHINGTIYRAEAYSIKDNFKSDKSDKEKVIKQYKELFELASKNFEEVRRLAPQKDYGYKTEIQFITKSIEFGFSLSNFSKEEYCKFLIGDKEGWFKEIFDKGIDLINQMTYNNIDSNKIKDLKIQLNKYVDSPGTLIQHWDNLLSSNTTSYSKDVIRRKIAHSYFAKYEFDFNKIENKDLVRMEALLRENLKSNLKNEDVKFWIEIARKLKKSFDEIITVLEYREFYENSLESAFYLYCLYFSKSIQLKGKSVEMANKYIQICKDRRDKTYSKMFCQEWIGKNNELINYRDVGDWDRRKKFFSEDNPNVLEKIRGKIKYTESHSQGYIELECGLEVLFTPGMDLQFSDNKLTDVEFYIGFNYNGPRAFQVNKVRNE